MATMQEMIDNGTFIAATVESHYGAYIVNFEFNGKKYDYLCQMEDDINGLLQFSMDAEGNKPEEPLDVAYILDELALAYSNSMEVYDGNEGVGCT